jgi:glycosyltransferase involved in cell wall biosynthesis
VDPLATVDVVIAAYNHAAFLPQAIDSVIAQTFLDWQIIVVDDGSVDNTPDVLNAYSARLGSRFRFYQQVNQGPSAARNLAIRNSSSPYIAVLDADDIWLPERLAASVAALERNPTVGLLHAGILRIDARGKVLDDHVQKAAAAQGRIARRIYTRQIHLLAPTITLRRSCLDRVGMFDESLRATEDRDLWLRIAQQYEIIYLDQRTANYRVSPNSATSDPSRMLRGQLAFIEKHYGTPWCGYWARRQALSSVYREQADSYWHRGEGSVALRHCWKAVRYNPFAWKNSYVLVKALLGLM